MDNTSTDSPIHNEKAAAAPPPSSAAAKKRKAAAAAVAAEDDDDGDEDLYSSSNKKNNRNERKRQLEKKRRDEVNNGLDKLMELLFEIDPKSRAESRERQMGAGGGTSNNEPDGPSAKYNSLHALNRVDLIHRSTELLRTLFYENQHLKKLVAEFSSGGGVDKQQPAAQAKPTPADMMVAPPVPQLQVPRGMATGGGGMMDHHTFAPPMERSESAPVAILNALREQRQALIDKQRSIDASLELIRSGRLTLPTSNNAAVGPTAATHREVSLDYGMGGGANSISRQAAAAAARQEDIRNLARFTASLGNNGNSSNNNNSYDNGMRQESAQVLANLRKNRDDLLEDGSEPSSDQQQQLIHHHNLHRDDVALAAALRQQVSSAAFHNPSISDSFSPEQQQQELLLARLRNSQAAQQQLANRELLLSSSSASGAHRLGFDQSMSGQQDRFLQQLQDQRLAERLAMEARMPPDSLGRSRTLDPALLLRHHHHAAGLGGGGGGGVGNGGSGPHRMY